MSEILVQPVRRKAREVVLAPRLPEFPSLFLGTWEAEGDITADCTTAGCGYHVLGPRAEVQLALKEHHRLFHPDEIGVVLLNAPRQ